MTATRLPLAPANQFISERKGGFPMKKTKKEKCTCKNCGNESEMTFTCSLADEEISETSEEIDAKHLEHAHRKMKGTAVCTHCGNEADMWIDLDE
jgi:DNA-directed RNA polymerase subunit M/transcription elongation factor TFIIS